MNNQTSIISTTYETPAPALWAYAALDAANTRAFHAWCLDSHAKLGAELELLVAQKVELFGAIEAGLIPATSPAWLDLCGKTGLVRCQWVALERFITARHDLDETEPFPLTADTAPVWLRYQRSISSDNATACVTLTKIPQAV